MPNSSSHDVLSDQDSEKLQKVLAREGVASRRTLETWIREGRIKVNDHIAQLGERITASDAIWVDGKRMTMLGVAQPEVLIYHKPCGEICARSDPQGRDLVFAHLPEPKSGRWISVGRLDINTSGLLLLTNQGELAHRLMHPSHEIEREYLVRVHGQASPLQLKQLQEGVYIDGERVAFKSVIETAGRQSNHWYRVILTEGRYREVRRIWEALGLRVNRLMRVRYGNIELPKSLQAGEAVWLKPHELQSLMDLVKL